MKKIFQQKGIGMVEVIVGVAVLLIIFLGFSELARYNLRVQEQNERKIEAINLAAEAIEAVRAVRAGDWSNIPNSSGDYHPYILDTQWALASDAELVNNIYTRYLVFETVCRDGDDDISDCPAIDEDDDTKKVTATVQWNDRGTTKQVSLVTYITNWPN